MAMVSSGNGHNYENWLIYESAGSYHVKNNLLPAMQRLWRAGCAGRAECDGSAAGLGLHGLQWCEPAIDRVDAITIDAA